MILNRKVVTRHVCSPTCTKDLEFHLMFSNTNHSWCLGDVAWNNGIWAARSTAWELCMYNMARAALSDGVSNHVVQAIQARPGGGRLRGS